MSSIVSKANVTAQMLGYLVLFLLLAGLTWLISIRLEAWRYRLKRARRHDLEWDNLRSAWIFDQQQDRTDTVEAPVIDPSRVNTDVLDFTVEQIYDYQKEHRNDVA